MDYTTFNYTVFKAIEDNDCDKICELALDKKNVFTYHHIHYAVLKDNMFFGFLIGKYHYPVQEYYKLLQEDEDYYFKQAEETKEYFEMQMVETLL